MKLKTKYISILITVLILFCIIGPHLWLKVIPFVAILTYIGLGLTLAALIFVLYLLIYHLLDMFINEDN